MADNLTEYEKKFNAFLFAKPWMKEAISGNKVVLNIEEWINKSSSRGEFKLRIIDKSGDEKQVFNRNFVDFRSLIYREMYIYKF